MLAPEGLTTAAPEEVQGRKGKGAEKMERHISYK